MNIRDEIYTILATLPYDVFKTKIDPLEDSFEMPGVSVQFREIDRKLYSDEMDYIVNSTVDIYCVIGTADNYDSLMDAVAEAILAVLLTNAAFVAKFSKIQQANTVYQYKRAGDTNVAQARIALTFEYIETFDPVVTATLNTLHTAMDLANTAVDPNLVNGSNIGPDTRLEAQITYTTV